MKHTGLFDAFCVSVSKTHSALYITLVQRQKPIQWSIVAEQSRALVSGSGVVRMWGSNPSLAGRGACVLEQDT